MLQMLRGITGEFEINRVVGAVGALSFIFTTCGLTIFDVVWRGREFSIATFCTSFPIGLGVAVGAIAGAVALKDRNVAKAKVDDPTIPNQVQA